MSGHGWRSIPALVDATVANHGDSLAVVDGDTRLTWGELHDEAQAPVTPRTPARPAGVRHGRTHRRGRGGRRLACARDA